MATKINELLKSALAANTLAGKASHDAYKLTGAAFALDVILAIEHGNVAGLNDLYAKLHPTMADSMRRYGIPKVMDSFGVGGVRKSDDESVWETRPVSIFEFTSTPSKDFPGRHFTIASTQPDSKYNDPSKKFDGRVGGPKLIADLKATKKAILAAGEEVIATLDWLTISQLNRIVMPTEALLISKGTAAITFGAKAGFMSADDVSKAGTAFGLKADTIASLREIAIAAGNANREARKADSKEPADSKRDGKPVKSSVGEGAQA